jgi:hypothetical protein
METTILGIVGNRMYLAPFYGGDNDHCFTITNYEKKDLLERGVKEYPSYDYIEAKLYGKTYEEYLEMLASQEEHSRQRAIEDSLRNKSISDDDLPF